MKSKLEIHPIQADILMYLLFHNKPRFSQINVNKLDTDSFTFHLKSLLEARLIEKDGNIYTLTTEGKEFANRFDTVKSEIERQAKLGVVLIGIKKEGATQLYLCQQRLKHPFFGYIGFITGKISWGETVYQTAARELLEETNLSGDAQLAGIEHKMDYAEDGKLLEDKFFYVCKISHVTGELTTDFQGGRNFWASRKEIEQIEKKFDDVLMLLDILEQNTFVFKENKFVVKGY